MSPLGWHPPHLVDNTDTHWHQHWHQCWFFRFSFCVCVCVCVCVSVCLSMFQLVCVFVCLFTINLKFLKSHNYWLVQLVYVSLNSGPELKNFKLCIKMFRNFSEKSVGGGISVRLWVKTASSVTVNTCLFYWTFVNYESSLKCLLSVC